MPLITAIHPPENLKTSMTACGEDGKELYLPIHNPHLTPPVENSSTDIPVVRLDLDIIPDSVAAKLATSLLGHVLFLKSQVPFPVVQLARIPGVKSSARAAKHRQEFLDAFDTLSSHLETTFTTLSTALALSGTSTHAHAPALGDQNAQPQAPSKPSRESAAVYLAFAIGPNVSSAKSRVILALDGFQLKVWGARDDAEGGSRTLPERMAQIHLDDDEEEVIEDDEPPESESDVGSLDGSANESVTSFDDYDRYIPSPTLSSSSLDSVPPSDFDSVITPPGEEPIASLPTVPPVPRVEQDDTNEEDERDSIRDLDDYQDEFDPTPEPTSPELPIHPSRAEEQQMLHSADRLLSRALALADVNGYSMSSEMAPSQIHVLIRAPRRFAHPAWIPRQNLKTTMDESLNTFLNQTRTGVKVEASLNARKLGIKPKRSKKLEGVWIKSRGPTPFDEAQTWNEPLKEDTPKDELDELIWWSWDGKIIGMADW